ncbi:MAG: hypothetical protein ACYSOZ_00390, partial [Planctomycetota bacterium]
MEASGFILICLLIFTFLIDVVVIWSIGLAASLVIAHIIKKPIRKLWAVLLAISLFCIRLILWYVFNVKSFTFFSVGFDIAPITSLLLNSWIFDLSPLSPRLLSHWAFDAFYILSLLLIHWVSYVILIENYKLRDIWFFLVDVFNGI